MVEVGELPCNEPSGSEERNLHSVLRYLMHRMPAFPEVGVTASSLQNADMAGSAKAMSTQTTMKS